MLDHALGPSLHASQTAAITAGRETTHLGTPRRPSAGGLAAWQAKRVKLYIDAHLMERIKCRELADLVNLSTGHFHRGFVVSLGRSPHNYTLRCRMEHAKVLMQTTFMSLGQIAKQCGMADQPHFCRTFLRIVGDRPSDWQSDHARDSSQHTSQAGIITRGRDRTCRGRARFPPPSGLAAWQVNRVKV